MNKRELATLLKSEKGESIRDLNFTLNFPLSNFSTTFHLGSLFTYVSDQFQLWDKFPHLPNDLQVSKYYFENVKSRIEHLVDVIKADHNHMHPLNDLVDSVNINSEKVLPADSPIALFLVETYQEDPEILEGAFELISGAVTASSFRSTNRARGIISAVNFLSKDSKSSRRVDIEEKSLNGLKGRVEQYASDTEKHLEEMMSKNDLLVKNLEFSFEKFLAGNQIKLDRWLSLNRSSADEFKQNVEAERTRIEKTYKELLQLQAPAEHWRTSGKKLLDAGYTLMFIILALVCVGAASLYLLLWQTPEGMLKSFFKGDTVAAIRWSIVFVTFLSLIFVVIQALRKAMFSSFHLARDSQEREKLTMYYLAMIKEGAVQESDRNLILQSLFARADSGLLKEDGSPAMPGGILEKITTSK